MPLPEEQECLDQYSAAMGNELGPAFMVLSRKLTELHIVWQQYRQLYGGTPDTIEILNRTAGLFFKIVQDQLWDSVLLAISRMTDPAEQGGRTKKRNLTIQSLPALIADDEFRMKVRGNVISPLSLLSTQETIATNGLHIKTTAMQQTAR